MFKSSSNADQDSAAQGRDGGIPTRAEAGQSGPPQRSNAMANRLPNLAPEVSFPLRLTTAVAWKMLLE